MNSIEENTSQGSQATVDARSFQNILVAVIKRRQNLRVILEKADSLKVEELLKHIDNPKIVISDIKNNVETFDLTEMPKIPQPPIKDYDKDINELKNQIIMLHLLEKKKKSTISNIIDKI